MTSKIYLAAAALVLFLGLASFVYAISVQNDFDFGGTYRIQNASTTTVLGGLSVGTTTPQAAGVLYVDSTLKFGDGTSQTSAGASSVSAGQVSAGVFGSIAGKGNYTFQESGNTNTVLFVDATNARAGVGTASPATRFHVYDGSSGPLVTLSGLSTNYRGLVVKDTSGTEQWFYGPNDVNNFVIRRSGSTDYLTIATSTGRIGIATSTPTALLSVGNTTTSLVAVFGGGSGKIDAGTIDPVYTIGGERYATYVSGMTGVKEETTGVIKLPTTNDQLPTAVLDFKTAEEGSDLWLFAKAANLEGEGFANLAVLLTPNFDGKTWYEKDYKNKTIAIYASLFENCKLKIENCSLEVSYRLTAPRFDWREWTNAAAGAHEGFNLDTLLKR
ncbi:MAG: hypothetical protein HYU81_03195 [Candidatus Brennerbacteria bacterium]|nr:hypothetical protein [Candidatus Brennerbacteria bacterium]